MKKDLIIYSKTQRSIILVIKNFDYYVRLDDRNLNLYNVYRFSFKLSALLIVELKKRQRITSFEFYYNFV